MVGTCLPLARNLSRSHAPGNAPPITLRMAFHSSSRSSNLSDQPPQSSSLSFSPSVFKFRGVAVVERRERAQKQALCGRARLSSQYRESQMIKTKKSARSLRSRLEERPGTMGTSGRLIRVRPRECTHRRVFIPLAIYIGSVLSYPRPNAPAPAAPTTL